MTYDNQDINEVTPDQFKDEVVKGENEIENAPEWVRPDQAVFPVSVSQVWRHHRPTKEGRPGLHPIRMAMIVCPATVIPEDFVYNSTLAKLGQDA